jgi:chromosome partitioning protein
MSKKPKRDTKVLATYNIKGGVGKTSAAVNLAYLAAASGHPTLLWDLDPQAASTYLFRVRPKIKGGGRGLLRRRSNAGDHIKATDHENLELLPADFSYRHLDLALDQFKKPAGRLRKVLAPLRDDYDYIFLDCPPSISLVSEAVFEASDALLVPVIPATLSSRAYEQLQELSQRGKVGRKGTTSIFAFFSMANVEKQLHLQVMQRLRQIKELTVLGAAIPIADEVEMMGEERNPVAVFAPESPAAVAYTALWAEVERRLRPEAAAAVSEASASPSPPEREAGPAAESGTAPETEAEPAAEPASDSATGPEAASATDPGGTSEPEPEQPSASEEEEASEPESAASVAESAASETKGAASVAESAASETKGAASEPEKAAGLEEAAGLGSGDDQTGGVGVANPPVGGNSDTETRSD